MESQSPDHDPKIGMLLQERYRIIRKLGEGGMGAVYEAHHELIGRRLAIKCLHKQYLTDSDVVERFQREAQAATAVGNEHIIEVTDMGKFEDGSPFIVLEYLDGKELASLLKEYTYLAVHRTIHIILQVCDALAAVHAKGIIHRDLKPENIFLIPKKRDQDFVKVLDFGISKMRESAEEVKSGLTKTGTTLGTPYYMSPEQAQGQRDVDHRADIYALGVIIYQSLCGRLPFEADSYPMLMVKIMTEPPVPLTRWRSDIPEGLERIVLRAIAKEREQRFQNVQELADALAPYQTWDGVSASAHLGPISSLHPPAPSHYSFPSDPSRVDAASDRPQVNETVAHGSGRKRSPWLIMGVVTAVVLGLGITGAAIRLSNPTENESAATANTPIPALPSRVPSQPISEQKASPGLPIGLEAPKQKEVRIKINASPSDARIFIGGVEFPNPMDAFRPRSLDPIRIRVEKQAYQTIEQLAIFDQDRSLNFQLKKGKGVKTIKPIRSKKPKKMTGLSLDDRRKPQTSSPQRAEPQPSEKKELTEARKQIASEPLKEEPKTDDQITETKKKKDNIYRGPLGPIRGNF